MGRPALSEGRHLSPLLSRRALSSGALLLTLLVWSLTGPLLGTGLERSFGPDTLLGPEQSPSAGYLPARTLEHALSGELAGLAALAMALLLAGAYRQQRLLGSAGAWAALGVAALALRHLVWLSWQALEGVWIPGLGSLALQLGIAESLRFLGFFGLALGAILRPRAQGYGAWIFLSAGLLLARACSRLLASPLLDPLLLPTRGGQLELQPLWGWCLLGAGWAWWISPRRTRWAARRRYFLRGSAGAFLTRSEASLAVLTCLGLLAAAASPPARGERVPEPVLVIHTGGYRLVHRAGQDRAVRALAARVEGLHAATLARLSSERLPGETLILDPRRATSLQEGEAAFTALSLPPPLPRLRFAERVARRALARRQTGGPSHLRAFRPLRLGLERNTAYAALERDPYYRRLGAAVLHARHPLRLSELFDSTVLNQTRGPEAERLFGEVLVAALDALLGPEGPQRCLQTGRSLPAAAPAELWKQTLAALKLPRATLRARVMELLEGSVREDKRAHVSIPRLLPILEPQLIPEGWRLLAYPSLELPATWRILARARVGVESPSGAPLQALRLGRERGLLAFFVEPPPSERPPWVQLGLRPAEFPDLHEGLWEPWELGPDAIR